jgi:hypothetical protein
MPSFSSNAIKSSTVSSESSRALQGGIGVDVADIHVLVIATIFASVSKSIYDLQYKQFIWTISEYMLRK